ncbi:ABC transporter permease [Pendulispora albinea]|uniref:ABC transporter permease n=1 Tax=Pendulispora albinea TaxID=2741071 RepID=A0ABZ2LUZ7_9BACT
MTALNEVGLIASREIRKNLRSLKGLTMVVLSLLGAIAVASIIAKGQKMDEVNIGLERLHEMQEAVLTKKYDDPAMGQYLGGAPFVLISLLFISIWLSPLLVTILGFDAVAADLQHRTVRYWTVRSRRASYFVGKVLGLWGVVAAITLVMHVLIWCATLIIGGAGTAAPGATFSWGFHFYLVTLPIAAAWCGLATLISSQFRTPILALFVVGAVFAALWVIDVIAVFREVKWATYFYPNSYDALLLSPKGDQVALGALACFGIAALTTAAGTFFFTRRDV